MKLYPLLDESITERHLYGCFSNLITQLSKSVYTTEETYEQIEVDYDAPRVFQRSIETQNPEEYFR